MFSEKVGARSCSFISGPPLSPFGAVISWMHFIRETLGWFFGASCRPAAAVGLAGTRCGRQTYLPRRPVPFEVPQECHTSKKPPCSCHLAI